jgi:NADH-quinone oxidoreductase subunit E
VAEIVGFYTLYHDAPAGKLRLQVCTDISCALRGADEFLAELCARLGIETGGTTPDGLITVEAVMCLAACDKAPMFQVQGPEGIAYHENMTVDKTMEMVESLRQSGKEGM